MPLIRVYRNSEALRISFNQKGVLISAGAKILGNIEVGEYPKIGAGSVVLHAVPPCTTVAGIPAKIIGRSSGCVPSEDMDKKFIQSVLNTTSKHWLRNDSHPNV